MGVCRLGPPELLVLSLARHGNAPYFVETGTLRGATAAWAAEHFRRVWTVELSPELHRQARERHGSRPNIEFVLADSRVALPGIVGALDAPAVFWLDAHWSGRSTAGAEDECPLLGEIAAVDRARHPAYVLIDDARYFLSPPPSPHRPEQWPDLASVVAALVRARPRYIAVVEDVIVAVPLDARPAVLAYCRGANPALGRARHMGGPSELLRLIGGSVLRRLPGGGGLVRRWKWKARSAP